MSSWNRILATAAALVVAVSAQAAAPRVEKLASLTDKSPEGAGFGADGLMYFTSAGSKELLRWRDGKAETFASLPIHALVVVAAPKGFVVDGHVDVDMSSPGGLFSKLGGAGRLVAVDLQGKVTREVKVGSLPNGLVHLNGDVYLAADSVEGKIWRVDMAKGEASVWLEDPRLLAVQAGGGPGANGLKLHDGQLYVAHTSRGEMYRIGVGKDGKPSGQLTHFGDVKGADDFDITRDGTLYVATHGPIVRITPKGESSDYTDPKVVDGGPALLLSKDQKSIYVFTSGPVLPAAPGAAPVGPPKRGAPELLQVWLQ